MKKKLRYLLLKRFPQVFSWKLYLTEVLKGKKASQLEADDSERILKENNIQTDIVLGGIFKGLKYNVPSICSSRAPKILGAYETELNNSLLSFLEQNPKRIINIGSAEGYYAVGLAVKNPNLEIIAVDPSIQSRKYLKILAQQNGIEHRLSILKFMPFRRLNQLIVPHKTLLLVDCEGSEIGYLNLNRVPKLCEASIIVETHDFVFPTITTELIKHFSSTHEIQVINQETRNQLDYPLIKEFPKSTAEYLLNEKRPSSICWLVMKPKSEHRVK